MEIHLLLGEPTSQFLKRLCNCQPPILLLQTITVFVLGAVNNPGSVSVPANTPLDDVMLRAGGVRELTANQRNVELVRLNRNGTRSLDVYALNKQSGVSNTDNPPLRMEIPL
jgi:protein involved in polysaccharide export with SLBB domain